MTNCNVNLTRPELSLAGIVLCLGMRKSCLNIAFEDLATQLATDSKSALAVARATHVAGWASLKMTLGSPPNGRLLS